MNTIRIIAIILFVAVIATPLAFFNFTPNSVSAIDNRKLAENPLKADGDLTTNIQNYVNDRIGFRNEIITGYTILNDKLFGKMVHPSYTYGKDGYVFGNGLTTANNFGAYHRAFADMVAEIQLYCEERNVPFLFVFNPAKPAVYQDKIADGINYNRAWVNELFAELDKRGVCYLDNTKTLRMLREEGIDSFNQKYDANHWNDIGAFYGTQKALERMYDLCDTVHVNQLNEFTVSETLQTSLLVSKFPIEEYVPSLSINVLSDNLTKAYNEELELNPSYQSFGYYRNKSDHAQNAPKALVFQGSYMNGFGAKYFLNAFGEYIFVHDYQNVIDFPYYFNIFQPECVIFEVAEYTFSDKYFSFQKMQNIDYNPALSTLSEHEYKPVNIQNEEISIQEGDTLSTITWYTDQKPPYVWMVSEHTYDMQPVEGGYRVTVETKDLQNIKNQMTVYIAI